MGLHRLTKLACIAPLLALIRLALGDVPALDESSDAYLTGCLSPSDIAEITQGIVPPVEGSPSDIQDLKGVAEVQKVLTTPANCERALREKEINAATTATFFGDAGLLSSDEVAIVDRLLVQSYKAMDPAVWGLKNAFRRQRPFERDPSLQNCQPVPTSGTSFPSGHAAIAQLEALVLSELFPSRAAKLHDRAGEVAQGRVLLGAHHPSDIEAGRAIGDLAFKKLRACAAFRSRLYKAHLAVLERQIGALDEEKRLTVSCTFAKISADGLVLPPGEIVYVSREGDVSYTLTPSAEAQFVKTLRTQGYTSAYAADTGGKRWGLRSPKVGVELHFYSKLPGILRMHVDYENPGTGVDLIRGVAHLRTDLVGWDTVHSPLALANRLWNAGIHCLPQPNSAPGPNPQAPAETPDSAREFLLSNLSSPVPAVRVQTIRLLGEGGVPFGADQVKEARVSSDEEERAEAERALKNMQ